jgi:peptidoglycan L-alanyl-D-glutamate endopeptidase CwlK
MPAFGSRSLKNLSGVNNTLNKIMREAIKETPIDFTITSGKRELHEQVALYAQGRTKPGNIVTYTDGINNRSKHQDGLAVDLYPFVNGKVDVNDVESLKVIAEHIKKVASSLGFHVRWGGDFQKFKDYPHFELA